MSNSAVPLDGARRAAICAAMLLCLDAAPAVAQPAAMLAVDGSIAASGLTLVAHAIDAQVAGDAASVRTTLVLRNDRQHEVAVQYALPYPARVARSDYRSAPFEDRTLCDEADLSPAAAEAAETMLPRPLRRYDVIVVAPGDEVAVEVERRLAVEVAGSLRRLRLPLPIDRDAPWVPAFSADVLVEADLPIRRLSSPTHAALADGIGSRTALLSVVDGFVYRQPQLVVEFEVETQRPSSTPRALERSPAAGADRRSHGKR
jgi:hypothetical protein